MRACPRPASLRRHAFGNGKEEYALAGKSTIAALTFLGFEHDDIEPGLIARLRAEVVEADGAIYVAGETAEHLFVVIDDAGESSSSVIEIFVEADDSERTMLVERVVGGVCGEMEFVGRDDAGRFPPRMFSARALTPGRLVRIPYRALLALEPRTLAMVDRRLAATTVERFRTCAIATDAGRSPNRVAVLASMILQLAEDAGVREGGGRRLPVKKTQQQLADDVGLTREVVNGHLNEWVKAGLLSFDHGLAIRDLDRFRRLVELQRSRSRGTHQRALQKIDNAIASSDSFRARNLALEALRFFPASSELQHRVVLAAARCGATDEAEALIAQFGFGAGRSVGDIRLDVLKGLNNPLRRPGEDAGDDGIDAAEDTTALQARGERRLSGLMEDVLALPARLLKHRFWTDAPNSADAEAARQTQGAYQRAYAATKGTYVGVNAASLALVAGNRPQAEALATEILARARPANYWSLATQGEALALLGRFDEAATKFDAAVEAGDATPAAVASTRLQMRRLSAYLDAPAGTLLDHLPQIGVVAMSGHLMLGQQLSGPDQEGASARLHPRVADAVAKLRVGIAYSALAAGSDILLAEAILEAKATLHAVLPFRVEDFLDVSVSNGVSEMAPAPNWPARFADCLARAASLTITSRDRLRNIARADLDDMFRVGNRRSIGLALLKADELVTEPVLLVVHDGQPPQNIAGTAFLVREAIAAGVRVETLACDWRPAGGRIKASPAVEPPIRSIHRPVLFLWLAPADDGDGLRRKKPGQIEELLATAERWTRAVLGPGVHVERRVMRSVSIGLVVGFSSCEATLEAAFALRDAEMPDAFCGRLICDFGPVGPPDAPFNPERLSKLDGAGDIPGLPAGMVVASEAFAAEGRLSHPERVRFHLVGRTAPAAGGRTELPLPSVALYGAMWRNQTGKPEN
jgi:CRP-like cAMP-binding protein